MAMNADQFDPDVGMKLTGEAQEPIFSGPALLANRVFSTFTPSGLRLTFMEQAGNTAPLHFRAAVVIDFAQAIELRNLLSRQLTGIESEIRQMHEEAKAEAQQKAPDGN